MELLTSKTCSTAQNSPTFNCDKIFYILSLKCVFFAELLGVKGGGGEFSGARNAKRRSRFRYQQCLRATDNKSKFLIKH